MYNLTTSISDHLLQFTIIENLLSDTSLKKDVKTLKRDFSKFHNDNFIRDRKYFGDNKQNCKAVWNGINEIIYSKSKANAWETNCLLINGKAVSQPKDIAEHFNDYFTSISKELQKHIPPTKRNFSDYLKNAVAESTRPNSIPTSILKKIKNEVSIPLSVIINSSFENGIFPNLLKSAQVIRVFKNGSRLSCNNYRPISLLSNIGKIIEKLIHKKLNYFLEQHTKFSMLFSLVFT